MRRLKIELWPEKVGLDIDEYDVVTGDIEQWLEENIGEFKKKWNAVFHHNYTDFYFKDGKDATVFLLRWA
jgi:hypothetical protein